MPSPVSSAVASRLEKAAVDNGFDLEIGMTDGWLAFASSQCSLRIWLTAQPEGPILAAFSQRNVLQALTVGAAITSSPSSPTAASADTAGVLAVSDIPTLHHLLRRAFQLGKSLPDELLHVFVARTAPLPRATEAERLVIQRVGQDLFRQGLLEYWEGKCAITGLAIPELLRASHIKPWAACETDAERLDVYNGLLLAPHLDAAFDQGFITLDDNGHVLPSPTLTETARRLLGIDTFTHVQGSVQPHQEYLRWHRLRAFRFQAPLNPSDLR